MCWHDGVKATIKDGVGDDDQDGVDDHLFDPSSYDDEKQSVTNNAQQCGFLFLALELIFLTFELRRASFS